MTGSRTLCSGAKDQFTLLEWDESFRPVGFFMQLNKARKILDSAGHCYKRVLTGTLPNKDFVLASTA